MKLHHLTYSGIIGYSLVASQSVLAQSLDEAINNQLSADPLPCAELRADGNGDPNRFTGGLADICGAVVPAGTGASTAGGNSATPVALPTPITTFVKDTHDGTQEGASIARDLNLFFTIESESIERNEDDFSNGFDGDRRQFIAGLTYRLNDAAVLGASVNVGREDGDYDTNSSGSNIGGSLDKDSKGVRFLASLRPTDATNILFVAGYDDVSIKQKRATSVSLDFNNVSLFSRSTEAESDNDYNQYGLSLIATHELQAGRFTFIPEVGITWEKSDYGAYSESGNTGLELKFYDDERTSLQSNIGITMSAAYGVSFGSIIPQVGVNWIHEFDDDQRNVDVSFTGDTLNERFSYETQSPDRNFFRANAGVVFALEGGVQTFANVSTLAGHDNYDSLLGSLGIRIEL